MSKKNERIVERSTCFGSEWFPKGKLNFKIYSEGGEILQVLVFLHNDHFKRGSFLDEKPSEKLLPLRMQMFGNLNVTLLFHLSLSPSLPPSLPLSFSSDTPFYQCWLSFRLFILQNDIFSPHSQSYQARCLCCSNYNLYFNICSAFYFAILLMFVKKHLGIY